MIGLTPKQRRLQTLIERGLDERGVVPTFEELAAGMGLRSKSGVHRLVEGLVERGTLRRLPHRARAIEVVQRVTPAPAEPVYRCPHCGGSLVGH
jgi:repressor LexA